MNLSMSISYDVEAHDPEAEGILDEIVSEEARAFVELVRRRLADAGVRDIEMSVSETSSN